MCLQLQEIGTLISVNQGGHREYFSGLTNSFYLKILLLKRAVGVKANRFLHLADDIEIWYTYNAIKLLPMHLTAALFMITITALQPLTVTP